jgi:RHS repeat-associated protein
MAGQYRDKETGLHYNFMRYYLPRTGSYLSPDPIGDAGGDNVYAYVADPVCWTDPLGLMADDDCSGGGGATFPDSKTIAKKLGTDEKTFHKKIKPEIKKDHAQEMKRIGSTNPDVGYDDAGNLALRHPTTKKEIQTDTPLSAYEMDD